MAGAVAMAAVMEDFESQPCKKLRKDADAPPVKTITNYFVPKQVEKPFSPPRSNNIMDYFKRTSPAQEIKSCSQVAKPSEQISSCEIPGKPLRAQGLKRTRRTKEIKKSKEKDAQVATDDVILIENLKEAAMNESSIAMNESSIFTQGNDTSALLDETGHDVFSDKESGMSKVFTEADPNAMKDSVESFEQKPSLNQKGKKVSGNSALSAPIDEKGKNKKSALRRNRKGESGCEETKQCVASAQEIEQPVCVARSVESVDKTSMSSSSTVTVSFEDFVHNHNQKQGEGHAISKPNSIVPETFVEGNIICNDQHESAVVPLQVSPRTLTVQAEVHPISPDLEFVKELKVASIFSRNKKTTLKEDKTLAVSPEGKPDVLPDHKRKSNVVLLEEDLELDVVESSPNPKSTETERKQFMNAFKQPNLDGFKSKTSKGQSKPNQGQENVPEALEKELVDASLESNPVTSSELSEVQKNCTSEKKQRVKKVGKKRHTKMDEDAPVATQKTKELATEIEVDKDCNPAEDGSSKQTIKELRRSTRDLSHRQSVVVLNTDAMSQKGRQKSKLKDNVTQNAPSLASTPKVHRPKRGIYRAEMLCPPDMKGSPIRMRISRVFPSSATKAGEFEISSPLSTRELNAYKKRKQARKLVEKAKALQQSKKDTTRQKETLRRSTRSKESSINYCEDEDSVVFLEEGKSTPVTTQESGKNQKKLRSLNEVLGKGTSQSKACKTPTASKLAPLFVEKKSQRPSGVISIFDDSSREASENSQDDEQFRAKREFLKSGLPESFRKQIAKTAANREAYSQACASFQTVVHVQQKAADCSIWNLQWPANPLLICLKESYNLLSVPLMSLERSLGYTTVPAKKTFCQRVSCHRKKISESVRQHLLEEIKISNPSFPHQRFFSQFVKRREDYYLQASAPEPEGESKMCCATELSDGIGKKRKRADEGEGTGKVGKKPKSSHTDEEIIVIEAPLGNSGAQAPQNITEPVPSRGRRGRLQRQKQKKEPKSAKVTSPVGNQSVSPETEDGAKEDVLWTEKYQPQHSSDVIGNMDSVRRLHSWLKEWKLRADRDEKRKQQEKQQDDDANESWLMGEGLEEMEDLLCNTLLITGPTGVGKTAAVYACAQELGFKVFEVNSSSQRSGRHILSQLKEATQSHQVDMQGVNAHKPSYFSNYSSTNTKLGASPRKMNSPRRVVSSPRKPPQSPRSALSRRGGLAPTSLASFFKAGGRATSKEANNLDKKSQTVSKACSKKETVKKGKEGSSGLPASTKISEDQGKRTATSLILFEEVDVIFDDDTGFVAAIKTFMTTTKRPVILTTSDPTFGATFDGYFEEIHFKVPPVADVSSYLQLLCLAENMRTDARDLSSLLDWTRCDIRQSLLHLQFWACSGGGKQAQKPLPTSDVTCTVKSEIQQSMKAEEVLCEDGLPPCHSACTESLLGIWNLETENVEDLLLKNESSVLASIKCWDLLSEVHSRGINLLYSNMESLLPLPTHPLLPSTFRSQPAPNPQPQLEHISQTGSIDDLEEPSDDGSPLKVSSRMRGRKKLSVGNKDVFHSDSEDDFISLPKPSRASAQRTKREPADQSVSHVSESASVKQRRVLSEAERKKSEPVWQCLSSLAEYIDHMSFLDSSLHCQPSQMEGLCRPQDFGWTGTEVKSGMTDDVRLECSSQVNGDSGQEIHAVLGHLSFRRCRAAVSKAWDRAQQLEEEIRREAEVELSLPLAPHRQGFSLAQTTPCEPRVMERRSEVMQSVLSNKSAGTLGNRTAVSLDYLPSLRAICRSERLKEQGKIKRRFLHYLDGIHFTLPKSTMELLASDFP